MLKNKLIAGAIFALALMVASVASAAYDFGPSTLKVGSKGVYVSTLQTFVGATADGSFGPMTKAKVMAWQASNGLTADGLFGNMSKAKANSTASVFPAGCTNASGFSTITGISCASVNANTFSPAGCTNASGFSPVTGGACVAVNANTLPAGCTSTAGFSSTTGASCSTGVVVGTTGPLVGGAGSVDFTSTTLNVESTATESKADVKVLGFKTEAQDSDIALTNVKVYLKNIAYLSSDPDSSEKLTDYIDTVKVLMGTTVVGTADASDFSRESGSPDVFSKSITLSGAVVREGAKNTFYVEVSSGSIDTDNLGAEWNVKVGEVRFQDGTSVIMTDDVSTDGDTGVTPWNGIGAETFGYESSSANDNLAIKTNSSDPDATTVAIKADSTTNNVLIGAFKLSVDSDSSDVTINEIPVVLTFAANGSAADFADNVIGALKVKIGSKTYDAELATADDATSAGAGEATYRLDLNGSDVVINSGDTVAVEIYADFNEQSGNYEGNTTVYAKVVADNIDAEGADTLGSSELDNTFTGTFQTLSLSAAAITAMDWVVNSTGTMVDFFFTVNANNDADFTFLANSINDAIGTGSTAVVVQGTNNMTDIKGTVSKYSGDDVTAVGTITAADAGFTVANGNTTTFRVRYSLGSSTSVAVTSSNNGLWLEIKTTSVAGQTVSESLQTSPTATVNL